MATSSTAAHKTTSARELSGVVVSTSMKDTVVVSVNRFIKHPKYKKFYTRSKRYHAHDAGNVCALGETVVIRECRPISKLKRFIVVKK